MSCPALPFLQLDERRLDEGTCLLAEEAEGRTFTFWLRDRWRHGLPFSDLLVGSLGWERRL